MKTKQFITIIFLLVFSDTLFSQKLNPDVDLISELVSQKQDEIKKRVLKNLVVKNIKTTNYSTYNTMYNLLDILTTEKNKTVMTKDIIKEIANYSINYSLANYFIKEVYYYELDEMFSELKNKPGGAQSMVKFYDTNELENFFNDEEIVNLVYESNRLGVMKDSTTNQVVQKKNAKEKLSIITNYIVDELYKKLSSKDLALFEKNGLFKEKDLKDRFSFGLNTNYDKIEGLKADIDTKLDDFVKTLDTATSSLYSTVLSLINDQDFDTNNLKDIKRENIEALFKLFSFSLAEFEQQIGQNSFLAKIGGLISKYVIYDSYDGDQEMVFKTFKIDVEAIILSFEDEFYDKSITSLKNNAIGIKPFFIIGLNYASFLGDKTTIMDDDNTNSISDISFVGEKIGLKFVLFDFDYTHSHKPLEWYKYRGKYRRWKGPVKDPLIDDVYLSLYGSGILYNVVDLKSQENFDFAVVGLGAGITFFNNLELNVSYSVPVISNSLSYDNAMLSFGLDIPIFEYLKALKKKNGS